MSEPVSQSLVNAADAQDLVEDNLPPILREYGSTGLNRSGGSISEEFLQELSGIRGIRTFKEMESDPIGSAMTFSLAKLIARLPWAIDAPENATPEELAAAEFAESCRTDMEIPWANMLDDVLSMVTYGWSYLETNYKLRVGPEETLDWRRSAFSDNKIGWKSFRIRAQETLTQWIYDDAGNLLGMEQLDPNGGGIKPIPLAKALLFRTTTYKDSPEGRSMLRGAYRPWYFKKRIEEFEAIGIERDLTGLPKATLPVEYFAPTATPAQVSVRQTMERLVRDIRQDATGGVVLPVAFDDKGNKLVDLELMASPGQKAIDTNAVVKRKSEEMAMSILMDFLMLGHAAVGSFALGTAKIDLWTMSIDALARSIADTFNEYAIKPLLRFNRINVPRTPRLTYGDVANTDLTSLGNFIKQMVDAGVLHPDSKLESAVREAANLPVAEVLPEHVNPSQ